MDELLVVLAAAQEPPSIALTNVVYELARHADAAPSEAVIDEALRLRPAAAPRPERMLVRGTVLVPRLGGLVSAM